MIIALALYLFIAAAIFNAWVMHEIETGEEEASFDEFYASAFLCLFWPVSLAGAALAGRMED